MKDEKESFEYIFNAPGVNPPWDLDDLDFDDFLGQEQEVIQQE